MLAYQKAKAATSLKALLFPKGGPARFSPCHSGPEVSGWRLQLVGCRSQGCAAPPCTVHSRPCSQGLLGGRSDDISCSRRPVALLGIFWCADHTDRCCSSDGGWSPPARPGSLVCCKKPPWSERLEHLKETAAAQSFLTQLPVLQASTEHVSIGVAAFARGLCLAHCARCGRCHEVFGATLVGCSSPLRKLSSCCSLA